MWSLLVAAICAGLFAGAALLLGSVVPFTLIVILPTNKQLLEPSLDPRSASATDLQTRWGRLDGVRSALNGLAFALFLMRLGAA